MRFRSLALVVTCFASACQGAEPTGEERAEQMVTLAKAHLAVDDLKQSVERPLGPSRRNLKAVTYDRATSGRFVTYYVNHEGSLKEFVVNQPVAEPYAPIKNRAAFIEGMMEIAAPESSKAERAWGAKQLDSLWNKPVRPLPVQVGNYVFKGTTSTHDTLLIVAADTGATGLKYRPRP